MCHPLMLEYVDCLMRAPGVRCQHQSSPSLRCFVLSYSRESDNLATGRYTIVFVVINLNCYLPLLFFSYLSNSFIFSLLPFILQFFFSFCFSFLLSFIPFLPFNLSFLPFCTCSSQFLSLLQSSLSFFLLSLFSLF